jgi:hypothetical protein
MDPKSIITTDDVRRMFMICVHTEESAIVSCQEERFNDVETAKASTSISVCTMRGLFKAHLAMRFDNHAVLKNLNRLADCGKLTMVLMRYMLDQYYEQRSNLADKYDVYEACNLAVQRTWRLFEPKVKEYIETINLVYGHESH